MNRYKSQQGMTVMELVLVVTIIVILTGIASLSISTYQRRAIVKEMARSIEGDFSEIRGAARTRQQPVLVAITSPTTYTACIDAAPQDGVCTAIDTLILTRILTGGVQMQTVAPVTLVIPGTFTYTNLGAINSTVQIIAKLPTESNRQYRVTIFPTGITRVEVTESGGPPWTRAW